VTFSVLVTGLPLFHTNVMEKTARHFIAITTYLLILLWVYAAVSKLADLSRFRGQMLRQPLPLWLQDTLVYVLPFLELCAALLLARAASQRAGLTISAILLLLFTGYIGLALLGVFDRVPCSCGGILEHMSWGAHFMFNLFYLALTTISIYLQQRKEEGWQTK
jgi:putative oxidoreductase